MKRNDDLETTATIRPMTDRDLADVRELAEQLGYPLELNELRERFESLSTREDHALLVACGPNGRSVLGWVHIGREMSSLLDRDRADVGALVVDSRHRGRGIGAALIDAAERWAEAQKLDLIRVRSNVKRSEAHRFYQKQGYKLIKSWHLFTKNRRG